MSGCREIEETQGAKAGVDNSAMFNCVDNTRNAMTPKDYANSLQAGIKDVVASLPALELMDSKSDVPLPPNLPRVGTSEKDLADDGIKTQHATGDKGEATTTTEFPNGVKTIADAESHTVKDNGARITHEASVSIITPQGVHEKVKGSGNYYDGQNKEVYTDNKDGSYTVYSNGGAYTAREDGTVTKEGAIKNPDGSWKVFNLNDPLGGLDLDSLDPTPKQQPTKHRH